MTAEEADKIIADFMGFHYNSIKSYGFDCNRSGVAQIRALFSKSLDALVPVWEKLYKEGNIHEPEVLQITSRLSDGWCARIIWEHHDGPIPIFKVIQNSPAEAAAIATARKIKEK